MDAARPERLRLTGREMAECRSVPFAGGHATVYSARCPGKETVNEDAAALVPLGDGRGVLVVADGLGGRPGGESAAEIAIESIESAVDRAANPGEGLRGAILDAVEEANRRLLELGTGAATTLAVAELAGGSLRPYHVGDSAILVVGQRGRSKLETIAHSPVAYAVEAGVLDHEDAMHHEERHLVSNMVGASDMRIEVGSSLALGERDTVLLATDGLLDNLRRDEIVEIVRTKPLPVVGEILARTCVRRMQEPREAEPCKPDDLTFILFRRTPAPRRGAARPPAAPR